jgi:hypothetical protein
VNQLDRLQGSNRLSRTPSSRSFTAITPVPKKGGMEVIKSPYQSYLTCQ